MKKIILIIICILVLLFGVKIFLTFRSGSAYIDSLTFSDVNLNDVQDGTYIGSCNTDLITVKVNVRVKSHKIESIDIIKHDNGRGKSAEKITASIIEAQSIQVDVISGATLSSKVILKAVEDALINKKQ